jgi:hydroxyacylglutathione hydrolase
VNTHGHLDHIAGNRVVKDHTGASLAIHPADVPYLRSLPAQGMAFGYDVEPSPEPDIALVEGVALRFDGIEIEVIHTPGHTPGGTCLKFGRRMIVGDTLFQGSVGRTDLPGGSWPDLVGSIRGKLFRLPADTVCYPGHGQETTLGHERLTNPFVSDEAVEEHAEGGP